MDLKLVPALLEANRTYDETNRLNTKALTERDRLFRQWSAMLSIGMTVRLGGQRGTVTEQDDEKIVVSVGGSTETLLRHNSNNAHALQPWTDEDENAYMIAERTRALLGAIEQMDAADPRLSSLEGVLAPPAGEISAQAIKEQPLTGMEGYTGHTVEGTTLRMGGR